jgi:alpha-beta hydrolase superfamily lysophospholipase
MKIFRRILRVLLIGFILLNAVSAFQAYKLTRFYDSAPAKIPTDQQTFWYKTKAILFGVSIPKSKNTIFPDSSYQTIYLKTYDGLKLEAWYIKNRFSKGTVILFHGHGGSKSGVVEEANYFASLEYNVLMVDFRAHGGSEGNVCTIGYYESADVKAAYDYISSKGEKNIYLWGISLGAATIIKAIHDYNIQPKKVILEMPFGSLFQAVKGRVRIMGLPQEPVSSLLTFWGGIEHGFFAFNYKPCEYAKKISCPVLLQWGAKDPRVTKNEIDCIYNNLSVADKKLVVYQNAKHESLCENSPNEWEKEISEFMSK